MCGFAGFVRGNGSPPEAAAAAALKQMAKAIAYRGPDDEQYYIAGPVGLAFRRLSIVDVQGGMQPFVSEHGSICAVVNGEIFNHRELRASLRDEHSFSGGSDCEIVVHLYEEMGASFLEKLVGMYALALWDARSQRLLLARDRFGIKPLFYHQSSEGLLFASEAKALLAHPLVPRELDWFTALARAGLADLVLPESSPFSFFKDIEHFPAAHALTFDARNGRTSVHRYWRPPEPENGDPTIVRRAKREFIEAYRELLMDSVRQNLMSDVELGLFLSGGIDSVAIASIAAREQKFHSFTVLSQSSFTHGDAEAAHVAASQLGLVNHQVLFRWQRPTLQPHEWKALLWLCETPLCEAEQLFKYWLHRYAKRERPALKVMLTGQGSDEFNGGYSETYTEALDPEAQRWSGFEEHLHSLRRDARLLRSFPQLRDLEGQAGGQIVKREFLESLVGGKELRAWESHRGLYSNLLQMYNLWHEDRTAAGNGIENRVPFLDHRLVELCMQVPTPLQEPLFWNKRILREAMRGIVPEELRMRRKVPFYDGKDQRYAQRMMYSVLAAGEGALLDEAFSSQGMARDVLDRDSIERLVRQAPEDPEYGSIRSLLLFVNMALLDTMARAGNGAAPIVHGGFMPDAVPIGEWSEKAPELQLLLAQGRDDIPLDRPVSFAPGVYLVRSIDGPSEAARHYLVVHDRVEFELSGPEISAWIQVLGAIDGRRSLGEIFENANVEQAEVWKYVEEALDFDLLSFS